jgi:hypothetical protein
MPWRQINYIFLGGSVTFWYFALDFHPPPHLAKLPVLFKTGPGKLIESIILILLSRTKDGAEESNKCIRGHP